PDAPNDQDEWILVARLEVPTESGYVPSSFTKQLPPDQASQHLNAPLETIQPEAPAQGEAAAALSVSSLQPGATAQSTAPAATTEALPASFQEMFARHDAYFKQVVQQREESFKKLEGALSAASQEIAMCREKNSKLTQRIVELDNVIEEERRRWRERLDSEKKHLFKGVGGK
ncbi:hypothetical protein KIPB_006323, partial [Kipferlia bialata]